MAMMKDEGWGEVKLDQSAWAFGRAWSRQMKKIWIWQQPVPAMMMGDACRRKLLQSCVL